MKIRHTQKGRPAFTLVELMVAMALIIFIMYVLAEAFAAGTAAFRNLKAVGDMNLRLRTAGYILRSYLGGDHFEPGRRLSDKNFWTVNNGPPTQGFFRIIQSAATNSEGTDLDAIPSDRTAFQALHFTVRLAGSGSTNPGDYFRATLPVGSPLLQLPNDYPDNRYQDLNSNILNSQMAEVAIFLRDSAQTTENPTTVASNGALSPQPLYSLSLRQRLLLPDGFTNADVPPSVPYSAYKGYLEVSANQDPANGSTLYFNNASDVTVPVRRFGLGNSMPGDAANLIPAMASPLGNLGNPQQSYPTLFEEDINQGGNDVLVEDVLSFSIKVRLADSAYQAAGVPVTFVDLYHPLVQQYNTGSNASVSVKAASSTVFFDTWSQQIYNGIDYKNKWNTPGDQASIPMYKTSGKPNQDPNPISIQAIQIILRVWDARTQQTRQSSIVVPL